MEVFASQTDVFTTLESNCLAYVATSPVVHYDVCSLLTELIEKVAAKSRLFGLPITEIEARLESLSALTKLMERGNQFDSWLKAMNIY